MLIPINLNDIQEPKPVPVGRYDLVIASCEEAVSKNGKPQFQVSIGIEGHDDAPNVRHYISLPNEGDEPNALQFKALLLKRFLTLFKQPIPTNGIDTEKLALSLVGARANAELSLDKEKDSDGNEKPDGNVYNRLVVPRMRGEGAAGAPGGRVAPPPPKR